MNIGRNRTAESCSLSGWKRGSKGIEMGRVVFRVVPVYKLVSSQLRQVGAARLRHGGTKGSNSAFVNQTVRRPLPDSDVDLRLHWSGTKLILLPAVLVVF